MVEFRDIEVYFLDLSVAHSGLQATPYWSEIRVVEVLETNGEFRVEVRDTTGAGDGFMGGVIYGILKGWEIEGTASFSNAVGALTASRLGGIPSLPTLGEVTQLHKSLNVLGR